MDRDYRVKLIVTPCIYTSMKANRFRYVPLGTPFLTSHLKSAGILVEQDDLDIKFIRGALDQQELPAGPLEAISSPEAIQKYLASSDVEASLVRLCDTLLSDVSYHDFDLVGLSLASHDPNANLPLALTLARKIKEETGATIVFGGIGLQYLRYQWERSLLEVFPFVDYLVVGRGEESLAALCELEMGKPIPPSEIGGLEYRESGRISINEENPSVGHSSHTPDFSGLPLNSYGYNLGEILQEFEFLAPSVTQPFAGNSEEVCIVQHQFMDGCVQKCAFCPFSVVNCKLTPPRRVVEDLTLMSETHGSRYFAFMNTQLNTTYKYAEKICDALIESGLDITWSDSANLENLDAALLDKMRRAGCVRYNYGIEIGSDRMLRFIGKDLTVESVERNLKLAHEAGIWNSVNIIFGMPYERDEDVQETFDLLERLAPYVDGYGFHSFNMKRNSRFEVEADDFKITPLRDARGELTGGYDEIGGLSWEERKVHTDEIVRQAYSMIYSDTSALSQNTHLVFYLYSLLKDKALVRDWIATLIEQNRKVLSETGA